MKKFNTNILPIIGISPGNSYFKQEIISSLLQDVLERYNYAVIFVPDLPAVSTYQAIGYSDQKAKRKAVSKGSNLKNKTYRALNEHAIYDNSVYVLNWNNDIETLPMYKESYDNVFDMFQCNKGFRCKILETTSRVLESSGKTIIDVKAATLLGAHYILAEFAFLEICPELFDCKDARYIYHKEWPVYQDYISGVFDEVQREHLSFEKLSFV